MILVEGTKRYYLNNIISYKLIYGETCSNISTQIQYENLKLNKFPKQNIHIDLHDHNFLKKPF